MVGFSRRSDAQVPRERSKGKVASRLGKIPSGTLWPNGEFSYAYVDEKYETAWEDEVDEYPYARKDKRAKCPFPLDSSLHPNQHSLIDQHQKPSRTARYGLRGMGAVARKKVRNSAFLLQKNVGRMRLSFLTLTVPPLESVEEEKTLASEWPRVTKVFLQRLKRKLQRVGLPGTYVAVTELQTKRYQETGQFCLHLHVVFQGRKRESGPWGVAPKEFRDMWGDSIETAIGPGFYKGALENVQMVKKSAEGYLGKYMSKSQNEVEKVKESGDEWMLPRQWWSTSKDMKDELRAAVKKGNGTGQFLEMLISHALFNDDWPEGFWARPIIIDLEGCQYLAGWVGRLSGAIDKDVRSMLGLPL